MSFVFAIANDALYSNNLREAIAMAEQSPSKANVHVGYGYGRALEVPFAQAVERAREALKAEGFGVINPESVSVEQVKAYLASLG